MKTVIIAEKPDQARKYGAALGTFNRKSGYLEGISDVFPGEVYITWCVGHLVELAPMKEYDEKYAKWKLEDLPFLPKQFKYQSKYSVKDQFNSMKKLLKGLTTNDQIVIATDPDREGEAIAYYVLKLLGIKDIPIKRLWANTQEPTELKSFFKKLKDGKETYRYYVEAEARGKSDYLVGMNLTRLITLLLQNKGVRTDGAFSVGRVQTPTLFMVYNREKEIENFKEKIYFDLVADGEKDSIKYQLKSDVRLDSNNEINEYINNHGLSSVAGEVKSVTVTSKTTKAPKLFKLGGIQKVGNNKWGYSLDQTLSYVQSLYDKGFLSYPRTDSSLITTAEFEYLKNHLDDYKSLLNLTFDVKYTEPRKTYVDNDKVLEHYAIVPTKTIPTQQQYDDLSDQEKNIYNAVVKQTLAIFADDYHYEQTKVEIAVSEVVFKTSGNTPKIQGWKNLSNDAEEEKTTTLPSFEEGEQVELSIYGKEGRTKPPAYLTEATLGGEGGLMETCGKKIEDEELRESLSAGIGTPATRSAIVKNIIDKGYITVDKKKLRTTDKGRLLCSALEGSLISSAEMTGKWEEKLKFISEGKETQQNFIEGIELFIQQLFEDVPGMLNENVKTSTLESVKKSEGQGLGICPKCNKGYIKHIKTNKYDFYACSDKCGFTVNSSVAGRKLSESNIKQLITKGKTSKIKGFSGKKGLFDAELKLDTEYKVVFNFNK